MGGSHGIPQPRVMASLRFALTFSLLRVSCWSFGNWIKPQHELRWPEIAKRIIEEKTSEKWAMCILDVGNGKWTWSFGNWHYLTPTTSANSRDFRRGRGLKSWPSPVYPSPQWQKTRWNDPRNHGDTVDVKGMTSTFIGTIEWVCLRSTRNEANNKPHFIERYGSSTTENKHRIRNSW